MNLKQEQVRRLFILMEACRTLLAEVLAALGAMIRHALEVLGPVVRMLAETAPRPRRPALPTITTPFGRIG